MDNSSKMDRYRELADKWLKGTITPEEFNELEQWYSKEEDATLDIPAWLAPSELEHERRMLLKLNELKNHEAAVTPMRSRLWLKVAASVLIIIGVGVVGWLILDRNNNQSEISSLTQQQRFKNDIAPANGNIILSLGNGAPLILDSINNGNIRGEQIVKKDNLLQYKLTSDDAIMSTVSTGKGSTYQLRLADGTHIWLDAGSSITFPSYFTGKERVVEITGQAYLEVAKDRKKTFKVKTGDQVIEVLGTHFNVNAYALDNIRTTLLEGSVKINSVILKPGQQSINEQGKIDFASAIDMIEVMAWKEGKFRFSGTSINTIMQHLERWYDVEVSYSDDLPEMQLVAKIDRDLPISRILSLLEMTGQVAFAIEGKKITVMKMKK